MPLPVKDYPLIKADTKNPFFSFLYRLPLWVIILSLCLLVAARFLFLTADFPSGLGAKGVLYTDEGWWSRNAVAWVREGDWHIDDGYNPIINLPVVSLLQTVWFKAFGVSLSAARSLTAVLSVGVSVLVFLLVRREVKGHLAWLAPALVLSSFPTFAFSRLALLEMPMLFLILVSLWLVPYRARLQSASERNTAERNTAERNIGERNTGSLKQVRGDAYQLRPSVGIVLSALAFGGAVLTKTTALFALPISLWLLWVQPRSVWEKLRWLLLWLLTIALLYGLYYVVFVVGQPSDSEYFTSYNVTGKLVHENAFTFFRGPFRAIRRSLTLFPILLPCFFASLLILFQNKAYRASRIFIISALWSVLSLTAFSLSNYAPSRYFTVLIVPIAMAIPLALQSVLQGQKGLLAEDDHRNLFIGRGLPFAVVLSVVLSLSRIGIYLALPAFTFMNMAQSVASYIEQHPQRTNVVMGHFADSLALAVPLKGVNDKMGFQSLAHRLETFNPSYYVFAGSIEDTDAIKDFDYRPAAEIKQNYTFRLIDTFNVYPGRIYQKPVFFYELLPK